MRRKTLDRERSCDAHDLAILVRPVEQDLRLCMAGDRGIDRLAGHALADVGVLGDRLQGYMRHALVDEAAAQVAGRRRDRRGRHGPGKLGLLADAGLRVGEQVIRILRGHQARAGEREGDATCDDRDPAATPLFGDVGGRSRAARRIQHQVAGVGGHQEAALEDLVRGLDNIDIAVAEPALGGVGPHVA
jgi:hypothetical protein